MWDKNPFESNTARANSCYSAYVNGSVIDARTGSSANRLTAFIHRQFRALADDTLFPCTGAKSSIHQCGYRLGVYRRMADLEVTTGLAYDLYDFVLEQPSLPSAFTTFVAIFVAPPIESEPHFEDLLWRQLQILHDQDRLHFAWDDTVSSDPQDPRFSFSFGSRAFFIVGLHGASLRWARRFAWPTIVFNAHRQFEALRQEGKLERIKAAIRERETRLQGDINPNLADFGETSEARQYSGKASQANWVCPFKARPGPEREGADSLKTGEVSPAPADAGAEGTNEEIGGQR